MFVRERGHVTVMQGKRGSYRAFVFSCALRERCLRMCVCVYV